ncbi:unnamed protein product [Didymodactylos carnosus]|uniref:Platelet-derived growth factor (PDGF) family profile domain-containing protein n=1 Tax=Didymodactylos carnosus TaxID=1234261 RepID=A0A813NF19_9BILA|nr:unnamed protein product [Didymodactylos carnosus]CAF0913824.1 unnamed protein product [Didymodactylos carnosus]CAF3516595.1 unnamed protein product [Didymodactylos carnosus]CAF3692489.1 unnamed protein product [Didymodactylos carnosus]
MARLRVHCNVYIQIQIAHFKAQLSKARTLKQALAVYADSDITNKHQVAMQVDMRKMESDINKQLQQYNTEEKTVQYVAGGCLPRVTCIPVYEKQVKMGGVIFPNCVEVHVCSGCCQEAQFTCEPTKTETISFSPIIRFENEGNFRIIALEPFKTINHTECSCKCKLGTDTCPSSAQILDKELCHCRDRICSPACYAMQKCQILHSQQPQCVCKRPIPGQNNSYFCPFGSHPDAYCRCETEAEANKVRVD